MPKKAMGIEGSKVGKRSGFIKTLFSLRPEHVAEIRAEARRRADETGAFRPDASAVLRGLLDQWMKRRK
jgi:hypothetical protein